MLQSGDCAERFGDTAVAGARNKHRMLGQMATLISERATLPVVTVGRLAGQFGKPRSRPTEIVDGKQLHSFRGLLLNAREETASARRPHAPRLLDAYDTARRVFEELNRIGSVRGESQGEREDESFRLPRANAGAPLVLSADADDYGRTCRGNDSRWNHNDCGPATRHWCWIMNKH